ncbi:hypothetical protein AgCh_022057 [Apium graveolens]
MARAGGEGRRSWVEAVGGSGRRRDRAGKGEAVLTGGAEGRRSHGYGSGSGGKDWGDGFGAGVATHAGPTATSAATQPAQSVATSAATSALGVTDLPRQHWGGT